jgi:hypothetical protein
VGLVTAASSADVAFDNFGPGNTFSGDGWSLRGPLAPTPFTTACRFMAGASGEITSVTVAIEHFSGGPNFYMFEVRADGVNQPGPSVGMVGWAAGPMGATIIPVQFQASPGVSLVAGTAYWLYIRGSGDSMGTWRESLTPGGIRATSLNGGMTWDTSVVDPPGGIGAMRIEVQAGACYANCDGSTAAPVLNVLDFTCFLQRFAAADPYANCDQSTAAPMLNVADFTCFLQKFAAGCP